MELIIHLSDIHFNNEKDNIDNEIKLISNSIAAHFKSEMVDGIVIAISGDLANKGTKEEFDKCFEFVSSLKARLIKKLNVNNKKCCIITCPGNHDLYYPEILKRDQYKNMSEETKIDYYTKALRNYFDSRFNPVDEAGWFVCNKKLRCYDFFINFTCANTTMGSILENNEIDKGMHHIPSDDFKKLETNCKDVNFLLMHHSREWFYDEDWENFEDISSRSYNVILFGHEHKNRDKNIINNGRIVEEICGGELLGENSIFNLITIDAKKNLAFFKAIRKNGRYEISTSGPEYRLKQNENLAEIYDSDFFNELNDYPLVDDAKLNDIFVFPTMNFVEEGYDANKIEEYDDFERLLLKEEVNSIVINGDDLSGKSLLAKSLFVSLADKYHPVLLTPFDFQSGTIENCFKRVISREYNSSKVNSNTYFQFEECKVAIFDDFDRIDSDKSNKIKKYLYDKFDKIVFLKNQNSINFVKGMVDGYTETKNIVKLNISPMLYVKRGQLIKNICTLYYGKNKTDQDIEKTSNIINETINKQLNILNLNPQFVVLFVNSFLKNDVQFGSSNGFTSVFQSNITSQLERIKALTKEDIEEYLYLLQIISYKSHISKEYPISVNTISEIITEYNTKGKGIRPEVSVLDFIKNLEYCKMIQKSRMDPNKFIFISSNYFSFFVAKNIVTLLSKGQMDNSIIDKLIKEMCFGVNGDILLYLAYIFQSELIIDMIYNQANEFFKCMPDELILNPKSCNIGYLQLKKSKLMLNLPDKKDKKNNLKRREKDEEKIEKKKKEVIDYNYTDKDLDNSVVKIKQAVKYIELLSKLLPDFMHLDPETIKDIINGLYSYSNKLLYFVLKPYEEFFEEGSTLLADLYKDGDIPEEFRDEEKFKQQIQQISHNFILNVYNVIARLSSSKKTIYAFDSLCNKNMVSNELIDLMVHENSEELKQFANLVLQIDSKYDDIMIQNYLKQIVRYHCLKNAISYTGINQQIINRYLITNPTKNKVAQLRVGKKK